MPDVLTSVNVRQDSIYIGINVGQRGRVAGSSATKRTEIRNKSGISRLNVPTGAAGR